MAPPAQPENGKTWTEVNKEHWDTHTEVFNSQWAQTLHADIKKILTQDRAWLGVPEAATFDNDQGIRFLDFACGNGALSVAAAPYSKELRGLDISTTMVKLYNEMAASEGLSPERMHAVEADILSDDASARAASETPEFYNFDLAMISMALHHIESPQKAIQALADRVAPGGAVLVIDWEVSDTNPGPVHNHGHGHAHGHEHGHEHGHAHDEEIRKAVQTVAHVGFREEQMLELFSKAGLKGDYKLNYQLTEMPPQFGGPQRLFFAVGHKPRA